MKTIVRLMTVAALSAGTGCDAESDTGGSGQGGSSSDSTDTAPTTDPTGPQTTSPESTTNGTTTSDGATTAGDTTSGGATEGTTTADASSSTTGEPAGPTPCQPEMSKMQIQGWRFGTKTSMPTFAEIARPMPDFATVAPPTNSSFDEIGSLPDPQGGGTAFITDPDGGGVAVECSVWDQDCPDGEKCAAWAIDGGSTWNGTMCVPVAPDPAGVGETCTVEGSAVSGVDTCEFGAMCWAVDSETNEGTCVALCEGSEMAPTCAPEATACSISNEGVLNLCLPICNPLAEECGAGQGCFPVGNVFQCAPVASGSQPGEPCEFINACEDGAGCVSPDLVPDCPAGSASCCTAFCELQGDGSECAAGQECVPWFEMGSEPDTCLEDVGVCSTPG